MTMPNHSLSDTPKDVLTVGNLGASTQNLNPAKVKGTAQGRMSSSFLGSTGGFTSGLATTATNVYGTFMGKIVDDADPTTVDDPEDVNTQVQGFFGNPGTKLFDRVTDFFSPILQGITTGLSGAAEFVAGLFQLRWDQVDRHDTDISTVAGSVGSVTRTAITTGVIDGFTWTRHMYTSNGTWAKPTPPEGKRIAKVAVACINGGGGGGKGQTNSDFAALGGLGGGYQQSEFAPDVVPSTVTITVGAGAPGGSSINPTVGGVSSFGALLSGVSGTSAIRTPQGALASSSAPGSGGNGGTGQATEAGQVFSPPTPGFGSAAAARGEAAAARAASGSAGGAPVSDPMLLNGGGGGGGGAAGTGTAFGGGLNGGAGGSGAAPGGGGAGSGGRAGSGGSTPNGAAGANGAVAVWAYFEDII